jgi:hypothetical protein
MNLLILDGPRYPGQNPLYRGTERAHPTYCDSVPQEHELNRLFFWSVEEGGELGVVHDLGRAMRYAHLLNEHIKDQSFEVIEVVAGQAGPSSGVQFLGFDLSAHYNASLLEWGFKSSPGLQSLPEPIHALCELLHRHYQPRLNESGLLQTYEDATCALRSMRALQALHDNLFEGTDLREFTVTGVYRVVGVRCRE